MSNGLVMDRLNMATDNKGVTCYLPNELETALTGFCEDRGITRKDKDGNIKPSLGTGIIEALKLYFGIVPGAIPSQVSSNVPSKDELTEVIKEILPSLLPQTLPSNGLTKDDVIETVKEIVPSIVPDTLPSNLLTRDELTESIESLRSELLVK